MKISVCLATYNGEKFIKGQLDSILCQLSVNDEVIISDDGSTDHTIDIILSISDSRIKLLTHNRSNQYKGEHISYLVTKNFENALKHATGDLIFLADQDDIWVETKVDEILTIFENQNVNLIVHDAILIDGQNNVIVNSYFKLLQSKSGFTNNIIKNSYLGCCMAFSKGVLQKSLPFPKNLLAHDMWLGFVAERFGNVVFINQKLIRYQRHESTVTSSGTKSKHNLIFKMNYRIQFVFQLILRIISLKINKDKN